MLKNIYYWIHDRFSRPDERGEYSAGRWQEMVRREAIGLCRGVGGKVLEVGCGEGLLLAALAQENPGLAIYGIDNDAGRLRAADERFKEKGLKEIRLALQAAPDISFDDGSFDAVICINVFFNMPSIDVVKRTLLQMKRVCKKGGKIIFDFRNSRNPLLKVKYTLAKYYDETVKDLPLMTYDPGEIEAILEEMDLEVVNERLVGLQWKALAPVIVIGARKR